MVRLSAFLWLVMASFAHAQGWSYGSLDNGAWFEAHVTSPDRNIGLHCGGRSPGGLPLPQTDEPMITNSYMFSLTLAHRGLGQPATFVGPRNDIMVVSGAVGFTLPRVYFDELNATGWIQALIFGDPLIASLLDSSAVAVDTAGQRLTTISTVGLREALQRAIAFCDARWAATGEALPMHSTVQVNAVRRLNLDLAPTVGVSTPAKPSVPRNADSLWASVQSHIARSCERTPLASSEVYVFSANIDGDGVRDYVIWWDNIDCGPPLARPFCGASQCLVEIFISSSYKPNGQPESLYAAAASVVAGQQGLDLVQTAGRLAVCQDPAAPPDCLFYWGWQNGQFQRVN